MSLDWNPNIEKTRFLNTIFNLRANIAGTKNVRFHGNWNVDMELGNDNYKLKSSIIRDLRGKIIVKNEHLSKTTNKELLY